MQYAVNLHIETRQCGHTIRIAAIDTLVKPPADLPTECEVTLKPTDGDHYVSVESGHITGMWNLVGEKYLVLIKSGEEWSVVTEADEK